MVTRTTTKIFDLCETINTKTVQSETDRLTLSAYQEEFFKYCQKIDAIQEELDVLLSTEELESELHSTADFNEVSIIPVKVQMQKAFKKLAASLDNDCASVESSGTASGCVDAKLPRIELPIFEGDARVWESFWEQFVAVVDNTDLPDVRKFTYLRSVLKGEAKSAIAGLALTAANYTTACTLLKERYGRREKIIFTHVRDLLALQVQDTSSVKQLWGFYNTLQTHVRSLESLQIGGEQYGVILVPVVLSRLSPELCMEWAREGEGKESDLQHLMQFLKTEVERRERSQVFASDIKPTATASALTTTARRPGSSTGGSSGHQVASKSSKQQHQNACYWCGENSHRLTQCPGLTPLSKPDRKKKLMEAGFCIKCFAKPTKEKPHSFRDCKFNCKHCSGAHNVFVCAKQNTQNSQNASHVSVVGCSSSTSQSISFPSSVLQKDTLLQTLQISVKGKEGMIKANVLFDMGSDRTYVSQRVVDKVKPQWVESKPIAFASFGAETLSHSVERDVYTLLLQGGGNQVELNATCIPQICAPVYQPPIPNHILTDMPDLVTVPVGEKVQIDILVGLDFYWRVVTGKMKYLSDQLVAQKTLLGWVVSGAIPSINRETKQVSLSLFCTTNDFWSLETIGISDKPETKIKDDTFINLFESTIYHDGDRYTVSLPWKEGGKEKIMPNKGCAQKRLQSLMTQFKKKPELGEKYHQIFSEMWKDGIIEEVKEQELSQPQVGPVFYLPHRPVIKESSASTKVRPVFDASAKSYNGYSLNDCVETGPNLLPDLVGILLRFRRWKVALTTDIVKAFLQIGIHPEDRDAHRFVWDDVGTMRVMRFTRVPFGNKASPFLLMATIKHHLATQPPTHAVNELNENLYMDDWLSGCDDEQTALDMFAEAQKIMTNAGMQLSKWSSNSESVCKLFGDNSIAGSSTKVLGMKWDAKTDVFSFEGITVDENICLTKRVVLSIISRLFDPLGLVAPFSVKAKTLFQTIWQEGLDWDQKLSGELSNAFREWVSDLTLLKTWTIPRRYFNTLWSARPCLTLHAFGDASEKAYGACVYLVSESEGKFESILLMSRVRVAPLKKTSLPRLELLGALLCARLLGDVCDAL